MTRRKIPFRFDLRPLLEKAKAIPVVLDGITISAPFISMTVKRDASVRDVSREIVIRMSDKRVLDAWECCDGCIKNAMESIAEIRTILVNLQVDLKNKTDTPLYVLIELMTSGIRQFLTFTEPHDPHIHREAYFDALELLRGHLHRCLTQVAVVADIIAPNIPESMRYDPSWPDEAYLGLNEPGKN